MRKNLKQLILAGLVLASTPLAAHHGPEHDAVSRGFEVGMLVAGSAFVVTMAVIASVAVAQRRQRR